MVGLSPKISEFLIKTTHSSDIDGALEKVITEYLELKLIKLDEAIDQLQKKWGMSFTAFKEHQKEKNKDNDIYSFEMESDFWEWEEKETLRQHYSQIRDQWK